MKWLQWSLHVLRRIIIITIIIIIITIIIITNANLYCLFSKENVQPGQRVRETDIE